MQPIRSQWLVITCSALTLFTLVAAQAGDAGGYLRLDGGVNFAEDVSLKIAGDSGQMKMDTGFRADLALGYDLNRWASVELETGFFHNSAESVMRNSQTEHLDETWFQGVPVLGNVRFQYQNRTGFVPYVGVGAGGVVSMLSINNDTDSDVVFAYQATAGVIYMLDELAWIDFGYKYLATADANYVIGGSGVEASEIRNHFIGVSVIWRF